jgi:predicted Zn-dependent protease
VIDRSELEAIAARLVDDAKKMVPEAEVSVRVGTSRAANVRFGANEVESCGDANDERVVVEVALGKRHASVTSNQTDETATHALVARAVAMARVAPEDPEYVPILAPQSYVAVPDAFDRGIVEMTSEARALVAQVAIAAARQAGLKGAGYLGTSADDTVLANSAGLRAAHRETFGSFSMTARTKDATGSGWALRASHEARAIDAAAVGRAAADKALRSTGARPLDPGKYTVVLEAPAVADLLGFLRGPLSARAVDEGRSALTKPGGGSRLGEAIGSPIVTLRSDPADPEIPVAPFDDDGSPRKAVTWLDRGVLSALHYSRYWGAKHGKEPTPFGNVHLSGGDAGSVDELVRGVRRGLLVTHFFYIRVLDPHEASVTGLTRDGLFLIEDGKVTTPVQNFRFNQSVLALLKNCDAMTRETWRVTSGLRVPAMRSTEFNMASVSEAV